LALPPRPKKLEITCPHCKGKSELQLDVTIFGSKPLPPRTDEEEAAAKEKGFVYRILWCSRSYDQAAAEFKHLIDEGRRPDRIEFVSAERDELYALKHGYFRLIPIEAGNVGAVKHDELKNGVE